jgi:hypothetical protein
MNELWMSPAARFVRRIWPRRNELMRPADWVQAALLLATLLLSLILLPVALATGSEAYARQSRISTQQSQTRHPATAVLEVDAPAATTDASLGFTTATVAPLVRARWQLPAGGSRSGPVPAASGLRAGDEVPIWLDQNGNAVDAPLTAGDATVDGIVLTALIWLSSVGLLAGGYLMVSAGLNRHRSTAWAREWARVEPDWNRHHA